MAFPESRINDTLHGLSLQWIRTEDANMELMDKAIHRWLCPAFSPRSPIAVSGIWSFVVLLMGYFSWSDERGFVYQLRQ